MSDKHQTPQERLAELKAKQRKYRPKYFYSHEQYDWWYKCNLHSGIISPLLRVILDGKNPQLYSEIIYDEETIAIARHKKQWSDSHYLGEGDASPDEVDEFINKLEKEFY